MANKVRIENHEGRLRLDWYHGGKRYRLGLGGIPDTPLGRNVAAERAAIIERDLLLGQFDATLLKYRPRVSGPSPTEINCPELFEKYTRSKKGLAKGTLEKYRAVSAHLARSLVVPAESVDLVRARAFLEVVGQSIGGSTLRTYLQILAACWDWARGKYHLAEGNPWKKLGSDIKIQPRQSSKPFSQAEIVAILQGFATNRYYRHYYGFVAFLIGVGCRPGEAAGLRWRHLSEGFDSAWIGEGISRGVQGSTKTRKDRTVRLPAGVANYLRGLHKSRNPSPEDLVFPAPKGGPINDRFFNRRAWRKVLAAAGVAYRRPYNLRHTAISHALAAGADPVSVAEQAGHDPRTLYAHYAHAIRGDSVFVDFLGEFTKPPNPPNDVP